MADWSTGDDHLSPRARRSSSLGSNRSLELPLAVRYAVQRQTPQHWQLVGQPSQRALPEPSGRAHASPPASTGPETGSSNAEDKTEQGSETDLLEPIPPHQQMQVCYTNVSMWVPLMGAGKPPLATRIKRAVTLQTLRQRLQRGGPGSHGAPAKEDDGGKPKFMQILHNISGCCEPGEVLALMGPSGSGKTCLLTLLGGRQQKVMRHEGDITYNGQELAKRFKRHVGFVMQDDLLHETLTVHEVLYFAAMLRLPQSMSKREKVQRVDDVIHALGLEHCRNTIVGGFFRKGISGGERKRTSIGHELLINPSVILLDEPTSGLDSTISMHVLAILQRLAAGGRAIVTTIHQPSGRLYRKLNKVLLLSRGHAMYYGNAAAAVDWFASLGFPVLNGSAAADWILDLASGDVAGAEDEVEGGAERGEEIRSRLVGECERYLATHPAHGYMPDSETKTAGAEQDGASQRGPRQCGANGEAARDEHTPGSQHGDARNGTAADRSARAKSTIAAGASSVMGRVGMLRGKGMADSGSEDEDSRTWGATYPMQIRILFTRALRTRRFEALSSQDICLFLIVGLLSGAFWWQRAGDNTVVAARDTLGLLFFLLLFTAFRALFAALFTFPQEYKMMLKERASGMYRLSAFYFARMASDLPMDMALPTVFVVIVYFMGGLRRTGAGYFFATWATIILSAFVSQSWGLLLGTAVMDPKTAQTIASVLVLTFVLTAGFFVSGIDDWISWLRYTSFVFYAFGLLQRIEFNGRTLYTCSRPGTCEPLNIDDPESNPDVCEPVDDVVDALQLNQDPFSGAELARNISILLALLVVLRVLIYIVLRRKTAGM